MNKVVCDYCNEPADIVTEPNWALICEVCGNESMLTADHDASVRFDMERVQDDGFAVKNLRNL